MGLLVPKLKAPIVLVHGLLGYDKICVGRWVLMDYFPAIPTLFESAGNRVRTVRLSMTAGTADRATQLKKAILGLVPDEPVHIIAHSMGGLDARYMISRLGMADRVLSLTSIGTPHRGTPFADWGIRRFERVLTPLFDFFSFPRQAFFDLTTTSCQEFNCQVPDAPGVRYFSVAGQYPTEHFGPQLILPSQLIHRAEGPNDGMVSVASATHGERIAIWDADHLGLVNWPPTRLRTRVPPGSCLSGFAAIVQRLADEGF